MICISLGLNSRNMYKHFDISWGIILYHLFREELDCLSEKSWHCSRLQENTGMQVCPPQLLCRGGRKTGKLDSACDPQRSMLYAQQWMQINMNSPNMWRQVPPLQIESTERGRCIAPLFHCEEQFIWKWLAVVLFHKYGTLHVML